MFEPCSYLPNCGIYVLLSSDEFSLVLLFSTDYSHMIVRALIGSQLVILFVRSAHLRKLVSSGVVQL